MVNRFVSIYAVLTFVWPVHAVNYPPRLPNVGDTCYLNAMLQCIHNMPDVRDQIVQLAPRNKPPLLQSTIQTLSSMTEDQKQTETFKEACSQVSEAMNQAVPGGSHQEDATEFWNTLMNYVNDAIRNKFRIDFVELITANEYVSFLEDGYTAPPEKRTNHQLTIPVNTASKANLVDHIKASLDEKEIDNWSPAGVLEVKVPATMRSRITHLPEYLPIVWMAYRKTPDTGITMINRNISAPQELTFTTPQEQNSNDEIPVLDEERAPYQRVTYRLNSAAIYIGQADVGHYYAYVHRDGKWFYCDDEQVKPKPIPSEWNAKSGGYPYLMFYERVSGQKRAERPAQAPAYDIWRDLYNSIWHLAHTIQQSS